MRPELILKSSSATGVWPMDADAVLKRLNNHPPQQDEDSEIGELGGGDSWRQLRKVFDAAVADKAKVEAKRLAQSIHSLQIKGPSLDCRALCHPRIVRVQPCDVMTHRINSSCYKIHTIGTRDLRINPCIVQIMIVRPPRWSSSPFISPTKRTGVPLELCTSSVGR